MEGKKWTDHHPEQPEGYLVRPSSKILAFLQSIFEECAANSSKDPLGAVSLQGRGPEGLPGRHATWRNRVSLPTLHRRHHKPSQDSISRGSAMVESCVLARNMIKSTKIQLYMPACSLQQY
ncbi:hypothetical protein ABBQ38_008556 [Trebouxia sp. C0009 RCD-2024]